MARVTFFSISVLLGLALFGLGFRVTYEVIPIVVAGVVMCGVLAVIRPLRAWLWGLGVGIGAAVANVVFSVPPPPGHVARYGESKPLPLPLGLTQNSIAQSVAGSLIVIMVPALVAGTVGLVARLASAEERQ